MVATTTTSQGAAIVEASVPVANGKAEQLPPGAVPSLAHTLGGAPYEPPLVPGTPEWDLHVPATQVDAKDHGTSDAWCVRLSVAKSESGPCERRGPTGR